jgi:hypothetical protein
MNAQFPRFSLFSPREARRRTGVVERGTDQCPSLGQTVKEYELIRPGDQTFFPLPLSLTFAAAFFASETCTCTAHNSTHCWPAQRVATSSTQAANCTNAAIIESFQLPG